LPHETKIEILIVHTDGSQTTTNASLQEMIDFINAGNDVFAGGVKMDTAILQNALNRLRAKHDIPPPPPPLDTQRFFIIRFPSPLDSRNFGSNVSPTDFFKLLTASNKTDEWSILATGTGTNPPTDTANRVLLRIGEILIPKIIPPPPPPIIQPPPPPPIIQPPPPPIIQPPPPLDQSRNFTIRFRDFPASNFTSNISPTDFFKLLTESKLDDRWNILSLGASTIPPAFTFEDIIRTIDEVIGGMDIPSAKKTDFLTSAIIAMIGFGAVAGLTQKFRGDKK